MDGADLIARAHLLGVDLLAEGGDLVPQVLALDEEGEVVGRTMLLGNASAADAAAEAADGVGVVGLVYLGLAEDGPRRALFLEAAVRGDAESHHQLFREFRFGPGGLELLAPAGFRVPAHETHLGPVFLGPATGGTLEGPTG